MDPTSVPGSIDWDGNVDVPPGMHNAIGSITFPTIHATPDTGFAVNTASPLHQPPRQNNAISFSETASLMTPNSALCRNNDIDRGLASQTPADPRSRLFELPRELFGSPVDVHARKWLQEFCADGQ